MGASSYTSLIDLLENKAENNPDFPLYTLIDRTAKENKKLSYRSLSEQAKKLAFVLQKVASAQDRALIIYPPGLDFISVFFGCLYAKVIAVPFYPPTMIHWSEKFYYILQNSGASVVLTTKELMVQIKKRIKDHPDCEKIKFIITEDWINEDTIATPSFFTEKEIAFLQYTSGSTGKPKGVMINHGNLLHNLIEIEKANGISEEDISVSWLPHYHDMGLIGGILLPLLSNIPAKLMSPLTFLQRPAIWLETMTLYRATATVAPNFAYDLCVSHITEEEKKGLDLSSLQCAMSGSEPIRQSTVARFIRRFASCGFSPQAFYPCYGLAESTLMVTGGKRFQGISHRCLDKEALNQGKAVYCESALSEGTNIINCGQPIHGCHLVIVNPDTLQECADKEIGEIWIAGHSVAQGYWQLPQETQQTFHARIANSNLSYLRTGDLGYLDNGSLYVTGRLKEMIIIRGRNYYPHDLEDAIHRCHPQLIEHGCAIFSLEEEDGESLICLQEINKMVQKSEFEEITKTIRNNLLRSYGIHADVVVLVSRKSVPKTTSGKIQRLLCKEKYLGGELEPLFEEKILKNQAVNYLNGHFDIVQILQSILNEEVNDLDKEKRLSEFAMDSVTLGELHHVLSTTYIKDLSLDFLLGDPSLNDIINLHAGNIATQKRLNSPAVDLNAEFHHYKNITPYTLSVPKPPKRILLTGATGFLGAYLLKELFTQTNWQITCLVQANSSAEAKKRIIDNMKNYDLWMPFYSDRINTVLGNLEKNHLGLAKQEWYYLADTVDLILHGAAVLNFVSSYHQLAASNVFGTKQLLDLAAYRKLKALHYVSTIGYFLSADLADDRIIQEKTELTPEEGIYGGYNQTKWLAERLVLNARNYNIPTVVYRPSLITGESNNGYWNKEDVTCRIIKGCIELGARPKLDVAFNFVSVNYVAKAIITCVLKKAYETNTYHLLNPQKVHIDQLFQWIQEKGFVLKDVAYPDWIRMVKKNRLFTASHPFSPLRPFFTEKVTKKNSLFDLYLFNNKATIDGAMTQKQLQEYGIHCETIDGKIFEKYLNYLIHCGYLNKTAEEALT
ncbi:acyl-CoA synthetase [Legionella wadsworthii]|uniref:Acyl-CoA synthetase n=1 Tax=Legionella wadsworthii TaxID=28088 RepID=A0A378LN89_9GAMM|nr:thioester reductase domain-containing protein [Legionella wadsworthii]STY28223.1 acyl-CoA synthetase [Legionella wadsworthii]